MGGKVVPLPPRTNKVLNVEFNIEGVVPNKEVRWREGACCAACIYIHEHQHKSCANTSNQIIARMVHRNTSLML